MIRSRRCDLTTKREGLTMSQSTSQTSQFQSTNHSRGLVSHFVKRCLSQQERLVMTLSYGEGLAAEEIAAILGLSPSGVRDIHEDVVVRLNAQLTSPDQETHQVA